MKRLSKRKTEKWIFGVIGLSLLLMNTEKTKAEVVNLSGSSSHIGTFEGSTTFVATGSNGVNPGLFIEVMDRYGKLTQYESEEGVITLKDTKEGAYVTQAKLLGKTRYRDIDTNEMLDHWEEGRNLELISVENPELKIVGKNLFDGDVRHGSLSGTSGIGTPFEGTFTKASSTRAYSQLVPVTSTKVSITMKKPNQKYAVYQWDENMNRIQGEGWQTNPSRTVILNENTRYINLYLANGDDSTVDLSEFKEDYQVEFSDFPTVYVPHQSATLNVEQTLSLKGIGSVRDELDLLSGATVQRIDQLIINGTESFGAFGDETVTTYRTSFRYSPALASSIAMSNRFVYSRGALEERVKFYITTNSNISFTVKKSEFPTLNDFKRWLGVNQPMVHYQLATEINGLTKVKSDYQFKPVANRDIYVDGEIRPLVCSVTIPTDDLVFVLNPNHEEGKQFVAPVFSITNETTASISLELRSFKQETNVFNDVLPTKYNDWLNLSREESKDIALGLVPIPSSNWVSLTEGPRYVAEDQASVLGEIKPKSSVDLTFVASHGQAFMELLEPVYKLVFVFSF